MRKAEACDVNVVMVLPNLKVCEGCSVECAVCSVWVQCSLCMQYLVCSVPCAVFSLPCACSAWVQCSLCNAVCMQCLGVGKAEACHSAKLPGLSCSSSALLYLRPKTLCFDLFQFLLAPVNIIYIFMNLLYMILFIETMSYENMHYAFEAHPWS